MIEYKRIIAVLLIVTFILTGCSLTDFDSTLRGELNNLQPTVSIEPNMALPNESVPEEIKNNAATDNENESDEVEETSETIYYTVNGKNAFAFTVKGIGGTYAELMSYKDNKGDIHKHGIEGIYYTLENVEVYNSFKESGMDASGIYANNDILVDSNAFVVAELTAYYIAPENGKERIAVSPYLIPHYFDSKSDELLLSRISEQNIIPVEVWYSDIPSEDNTELDKDKQGTSFMINDGEKFTFKIGISVGRDFVSDNNVYLRVGYLSDKTEGAVHQIFELLPDNNYSWTITEEQMNKKLEKYNDKAFLTDDEQFTGAQNIAVDTYTDKVIIKGIGETFPLFIKYKFKKQDTIECMGADNVYLTLNNVEIFDNFYASGLSEDKITPQSREVISINESYAGSLKTNYFIVAELSAEYMVNESTITTYTHIGSEDLIGKHSTDFSDKIGYDNMAPGILWYSGEYDSAGQMIMTLTGGEKYTFKVGILVGEEYVTNNNLYLRVCNRNPDIEDYVYQLFELLPEKGEQK